MIVPGLAFDAAGRRVGFGGGYYDGVIDEARAGGATVIGFAYDFQIVDRCPAGPERSHGRRRRHRRARHPRCGRPIAHERFEEARSGPASRRR